MSLLGLWITNAISCVIVVINAFCWGRVKKALGQFQFNIPFVFKLAFNRYFVLVILLGIFNAIVTYYAQAILGVASGQFFYYFGTPVIIIASYFTTGERFTKTHLFGCVLILAGTLLISGTVQI